jgi:hypothetical protein
MFSVHLYFEPEEQALWMYENTVMTNNRHTTHKYVRSGENYTPITGASTIPPLHQGFN